MSEEQRLAAPSEFATAAAPEGKDEKLRVSPAAPRAWLLLRAAKALLGVRFSVLLATLLSLANASRHVRRVLEGNDLDALMVVFRCCTAVGITIATLVLLSLQRATRDGGPLAVLSKHPLPPRARRSLLGTKVVCSVVAAFQAGMVGVLVVLYRQCALGQTSMNEVTKLRHESCVEGLHFMIVWPLQIAWFYSVKLGAAHASAAITDALLMIERTEPTSEAWETEVVPAVLALQQETLPVLSEGWSTSIVAVFGGCWVFALGSLARILSSLNCRPGGSCEGNVSFFYISLPAVTLIPLVLSLDIARASSQCESLQVALNAKHSKDLAEHHAQDSHNRIMMMETMLDRLNRRLGLGSVVAGTVFTRTTLSRIFVALASVQGTVLPLVLAMSPELTLAAAGNVTSSVDCSQFSETDLQLLAQLVGK